MAPLRGDKTGQDVVHTRSRRPGVAEPRLTTLLQPAYARWRPNQRQHYMHAPIMSIIQGVRAAPGATEASLDRKRVDFRRLLRGMAASGRITPAGARAPSCTPRCTARQRPQPGGHAWSMQPCGQHAAGATMCASLRAPLARAIRVKEPTCGRQQTAPGPPPSRRFLAASAASVHTGSLDGAPSCAPAAWPRRAPMPRMLTGAPGGSKRRSHRCRP